MARKKPTTCVNGCDAPICPPSEVICRGCMDKITKTLEGLVNEFYPGRQRAETNCEGKEPDPHA